MNFEKIMIYRWKEKVICVLAVIIIFLLTIIFGLLLNYIAEVAKI